MHMKNFYFLVLTWLFSPSFSLWHWSEENFAFSRSKMAATLFHNLARSNLPGKWRENVVITSLSQPLQTCGITGASFKFWPIGADQSPPPRHKRPILRWFLRNKSYRWFFLKLSLMFSTKDRFEKYNKNDRSPFSFKRCDGPILPHLCLYWC